MKYYTQYKKLHQNKMNIALHIIGNITTLVFIAACLYTQEFWFLLVAPIIVYPFAWAGHYFFEKNVPAAFSNPIKAKLSDWKMMRELLNGTYWIDYHR